MSADGTDESNVLPLASVLGGILDRAAATPQSKAIASELGTAVLTVSKVVNTALLPIAAINFALDKARHYFSGQFEDDLSKLTNR